VWPAGASASCATVSEGPFASSRFAAAPFSPTSSSATVRNSPAGLFLKCAASVRAIRVGMQHVTPLAIDEAPLDLGTATDRVGAVRTGRRSGFAGLQGGADRALEARITRQPQTDGLDANHLHHLMTAGDQFAGLMAVGDGDRVWFGTNTLSEQGDDLSIDGIDPAAPPGRCPGAWRFFRCSNKRRCNQRPPSTCSTWPLTNDERSEAKKRTALAISSALPRCLSAMRSTSAC
jgi:hypothetical protein